MGDRMVSVTGPTWNRHGKQILRFAQDDKLSGSMSNDATATWPTEDYSFDSEESTVRISSTKPAMIPRINPTR